jgi:uncharacterized membrane protein
LDVDNNISVNYAQKQIIMEVGKMAKLERIITINAPVEKVFSYITDPNKQPEWQSAIIEVRDITGEGVGQRFGWTYKAMGFTWKGEDEVLKHIPNQRYATRSTGGIKSTWTYNFKAEGGRTRVDLELEYTMPVPVLGKFAEHFAIRQAERIVDHDIATLKDILEI